MRSGNPVLSNNLFSRFGYNTSYGNAMTMSGTIGKTALLLLLACLTGGYTWYQFTLGHVGFVQGAMIGGVIGGLIAALVTAFKPTWAPVSAPIYALLEGLFLGGASAFFDAQYPGIAFQAVTLTLAVMAIMLFVYQSKLIQVTNKFRLGVVAATGGVALVYFIAIILSFFGIQSSFIFGNGLFSIVFSFIVVGIAALNLILDFDFIEQGANRGAPKFMEWYGAFSLMVTLVWLYIEMLRLLSKMRSR